MEAHDTQHRPAHEKNDGHKRRSRSQRSHRTRASGLHNNRHVQENLRDHAALIGRDMRELANVATERMREQLNPIEEYVQEKPIQSLLIAAGVGALLGLVFLRR